MNTQDEKQDIVQSAAYNPFPEPQTIPSGWDLSELTSLSQADIQINKDEAVEGQDH